MNTLDLSGMIVKKKPIFVTCIYQKKDGTICKYRWCSNLNRLPKNCPNCQKRGFVVQIKSLDQKIIYGDEKPTNKNDG